MKTKSDRKTELAAVEVLRQTGVDVLEAALVAKRALEAGRGRVRRAMACIAAGEEELRRREKTITFARAVEEALEARKDRRKRTLCDFRGIAKRFMRRCKGLATRRMRSISAEECKEYINQAFDTPRQRNKARLILSGVFSTACKRGWCAENPVRKVEPKRLEEKRISILNKEEIGRLMHTAETFVGGTCLAAPPSCSTRACARMKWNGCAGATYDSTTASSASPRTTAKPAAPGTSPSSGPWHASCNASGVPETSESAHRTGDASGRDYTARQASRVGSRTSCGTPLPRTTWQPSATMPSCSWKWATARRSCFARDTSPWKACTDARTPCWYVKETQNFS